MEKMCVRERKSKVFASKREGEGTKLGEKMIERERERERVGFRERERERERERQTHTHKESSLRWASGDLMGQFKIWVKSCARAFNDDEVPYHLRTTMLVPYVGNTVQGTLLFPCGVFLPVSRTAIWRNDKEGSVASCFQF